MRKLIQNGPVVTPHRIIQNGGVLVEDDKIVEVLEKPLTEIPPDIKVIDAARRTISPGFVDIHVHGGGGYGFFGGTVDEIQKACLAHTQYGTTSILPTTSAGPLDKTCDSIDNIKTAAENPTGADILGVHLEGPYFSQAQRGAQMAEYIITPNEANLSILLDRWDGVRMMGAAPEIPGGYALGRELTRRGITASIAHSDGSFEDVERAMENGYTDITHLYSGCSHVHRRKAYRYAGVVEAGLYFDALTVQVIADGKHLPPSLLRLIYKCKGADKIALITDGLNPSASDIPEGTVYTYENGDQTILDDGVMKMMGFESFAGSVVTTNKLVRNMMQLASVPLLAAVKMASLTPAKVINAKNKGCLAAGYDADIILFDANIDVSMVMVRGRVVV